MLKLKSKGWGDGSVFVITECSSRAPGFNSQNKHKCSQMSVTQVPEDLPPSQKYICRESINMQNKNKYIFKKSMKE